MTDDHQDKVRERAYRLWEEAGYPEGEQDAHWQRAEREITEEATGRKATSAPGSAAEPGPSLLPPKAPKPARRPRKKD